MPEFPCFRPSGIGESGRRTKAKMQLRARNIGNSGLGIRDPEQKCRESAPICHCDPHTLVIARPATLLSSPRRRGSPCNSHYKGGSLPLVGTSSPPTPSPRGSAPKTPRPLVMPHTNAASAFHTIEKKHNTTLFLIRGFATQKVARSRRSLATTVSNACDFT